MIRDKIIICFASGWHFHPTSKHHVMRHLSRLNDVIWVNWHASRQPRVGLGDLSAGLSRLLQMRRGTSQAADRITVTTPWQIPLPASIRARAWNTARVQRCIEKVLRGLPDRPVQIWSFAPDAGDLVGRFHEELVVYYCVDAFSEFPGYDRGLIERRERELIAATDLIITTSQPLYDARRSQHDNVHLVQHGVDHAHLSRAVTDELDLPTDLRSIPRPIFGFVGVVGEWVDLRLVADLAKRCPDASILMIGPEITSRGPCQGVANVHWLGPKEHALLPNYLRRFDVALIPFHHGALTHHANPIKLFEYLAAGVPVVSTTRPSVTAVPGAVWLADDADRLAACCREAVAMNSLDVRRQRSDLMANESWPSRLEHISTLVEATLASKSAHQRPPTRPSHDRAIHNLAMQETAATRR